MHRYTVNVLTVFICLIAVGCATQPAAQNAESDVPKCAAGSPDVAASNQRCLDLPPREAWQGGTPIEGGHCACNGPTPAGGTSCRFDADCYAPCSPSSGRCQ